MVRAEQRQVIRFPHLVSPTLRRASSDGAFHMIVDANYHHDPLGKVDMFIHHKRCAIKAGLLDRWIPYDHDAGFEGCRCKVCRTPIIAIKDPGFAALQSHFI
jgi:hypothetical protein